jgi:hypothetical protein
LLKIEADINLFGQILSAFIFIAQFHGGAKVRMSVNYLALLQQKVEEVSIPWPPYKVLRM